jgi:pimeloyl-ACP methyl ester carboxylesterase
LNTNSIEAKTVRVGETVWNYFAAGNGSEGFLILPGSLGVGEEIVRLMEQVAPDKRLVAPQYAPVATVIECLDAIDGILESEAIASVVVYCGSFGGLIAQCWLRRHPHRVTHFILSGSGPPEPARAIGNKRLLRYLRFFPMSLLRAMMRIAVRRMLRQTKEDREIWHSEFFRLIERLNSSDLASRYQIAIDFDQNYRFTPSDLQDVPVKILLLEGSRDRVATAKIRESMRKLYPQAKVHTFDEAGHALLFTHTEEWMDVLRDFLAQ